jgi:ABC 3 transport family
VAAATTVTLPVVGALLIFSLMIGPPAAARALTRRPALALVLSVLLALLTAWAAIASSYETNWPVGFFVGAYGAVCFVGGRLWVAVVVPQGGRVRYSAASGMVVARARGDLSKRTPGIPCGYMGASVRRLVETEYAFVHASAPIAYSNSDAAQG